MKRKIVSIATVTAVALGALGASSATAGSGQPQVLQPQVPILMADLRIVQIVEETHSVAIRNSGNLGTPTQPVAIDHQGRPIYGFSVWFCYQRPLGRRIVTHWVSPLAPGQSVKVSVASVVADNPPEPLIGVTVDPHNFVPELFKSNNDWGAGCRLGSN